MLPLFARIVFAACSAGIVAGLALSALQALLSTPLVVEAETYEFQSPGTAVDPQRREPAPSARNGGGESADHVHDHGHEHGGPHDHAQAWAPADGLQRTFFSGVANVGLAIGFGLLLCALFAVRKPVSLLQGLGWGLAGYIAFFVSPSLGLHPELPGAAAADLLARQTWWLSAATSALVGIVLLVLSNNWLMRALGVAIMVAPHLWGAPQPESLLSPVPLELEHQFVVATSVVNGVFWLLIGLMSAYAMSRFDRNAH